MRRGAFLLIAVTILTLLAEPAYAASWQRRIDKLVRHRSMSVVLRDEGRTYYSHGGNIKRIPASNEKLLLSMALFDRLAVDGSLPTRVLSGPRLGSVIWGDVWLVGRGDPTVSNDGPYARYFGRDATRIEALAESIKATGITKIAGSVLGDTGYFARDWFAPGWERDFPAEQVALPTALTFKGNTAHGRHVRDPERRAAQALTKALRTLDITVGETAGSGRRPDGLSVLAEAGSAPLATLAAYMNKPSNNFIGEMFAKLLGAHVYGAPGTIAKGARAIEAFAAAHGRNLTANDGSGLSYANRVSAATIVKLLGAVEKEAWGPTLRATLAAGGQGTLDDRLEAVPIRAKTGTLDRVSALSGWVYIESTGRWAEFSILSRGMYKSTAAPIEDAIVRIMSNRARPPAQPSAAREVAAAMQLSLASVFG